MRAPLLGRILILVALVGGCGSDTKDPGPPQLMKFLAVVPNEMDVDLLAPPDGGVPAISGIATFKLVFNQLLNGDKIETVTPGMPPVPNKDVASITWVNAPPGPNTLMAATSYDPSGATGVTMPAPKLLINPVLGLPSGAQLQVKLDRTKVTGKKGAPFVGADTQMVTTAPFAATASVVDGDVVGADLQLGVTFSNAPSGSVSAGAHVILTAGGTPVPATVMPDPADPRKITIAPMMGSWTIGQSYTLTVDAEAADLFNVKLGQAMVVKFSIRDPNAEAGPSAPDGGAIAPDGGVPGPDGGFLPDAGVDAAATVDAAGGDGAGGGG
jgi:hypothetical protein